MATAPSLHLLLLLRPPNSPQSLSPLKDQLSFSIATRKSNSLISLRPRRHSRFAPVAAAQSTVVRVLQTVWRVGKDGIEAGTRLVPDPVPRPIARISVAGVAVLVSLFLLKSILSTAFFVLAMMGLIYTAFVAMNKDEGPRSDGGSTNTEDTLEEARRIMEKYK
ncbi:hypothetical protein Sjap_008731 [Stephania japonica]|uniref:Uncharacterized protein n=1 Tax=Stephania japonica TaxID=461633 RepID=A0AAP0JSH3_9MAGN